MEQEHDDYINQEVDESALEQAMAENGEAHQNSEENRADTMLLQRREEYDDDYNDDVYLDD